jgi:hypothetical protein
MWNYGKTQSQGSMGINRVNRGVSVVTNSFYDRVNQRAKVFDFVAHFVLHFVVQLVF